MVDKSGVVRYAEYVPDVANEPDYDKVMEVVKNLL